jgi:hypothetical protein
MPWTPQGGWHDPWLPLADTTRNVEMQRHDENSTLTFTRDLRSDAPFLRFGRPRTRRSPRPKAAGRGGVGTTSSSP